MALSETLPRLWYRRGLALPLLPLLPFSWLFAALSGLRRLAFRCGFRRAERLPVPVIVVGNLIAGGAGKTPLTLSLVAELQAKGWRPGIVSRGHGGDTATAKLVDASGEALVFGDEPLLMARRSGVPVAVCRDRAAAGRLLLARHPECDVLVADDGLQHYGLARDVELVVFDARGVGNGHLLPAGPLREPLARLAAVDAVVLNGDVPLPRLPPGVPAFQMRLAGATFVSFSDPALRCAPGDLAGKSLHAFAGIGDPARFFGHLEALGLRCIPHPFPDHHRFAAADFAAVAGAVVLLTEKDAVKCAGLITGEAWVLPVGAELSPGLIERILEKIDGRKAA
ncbi:MAG: tetraacyldisaccharide 4'-kinase [Rhodocyclaceae bacterium]